jgi:hypothetical protein
MKKGYYSIDQTYQEILRARRPEPVRSRRLYFEYVSKYRRIIVVEDAGGFEIEVTYKADAKHIPSWTKRYGAVGMAIAWAEAIADNREIRINGIMTIREAPGKRLI